MHEIRDVIFHRHPPAVIPLQQNAPIHNHIVNRDTLCSSASQSNGICERLGDWFKKQWTAIWTALEKCFCPKKVARIRALEEQVRAAEGAKVAARTEMLNAGRDSETARIHLQEVLNQLNNAAEAQMQAVRVLSDQRRALRRVPQVERAALVEGMDAVVLARQERDREEHEAFHRQMQAMNACVTADRRYFQLHGTYTEALERLYEIRTELNIARI